MAVIENAVSSPEALAKWRAAMRKMDRGELMAQQLVQRGAEHALAELQKLDVTPERCADMLASIREALIEVHAVATERGINLVGYEAPTESDEDPIDAELKLPPAVEWPKTRDVGRLEDMSPDGVLRISFDSDNDVSVGVYDERGSAVVEFCTPGSGGGKSSRTRRALIALMVAMEADNAEDPGRDWWALRAQQGAALQVNSTEMSGGAT